MDMAVGNLLTANWTHTLLINTIQYSYASQDSNGIGATELNENAYDFDGKPLDRPYE